MLGLMPRVQLVVGVALALLIAATRGHHFASLNHLPAASWAVFFLAGVYLRPRWVFIALLAEAAALDIVAVTWGGVSNFCVSPAYGFLLPAYGALWASGRWYASHHRDTLSTLVPLSATVLAGTAICELISSGSFYFLSGRFEHTHVAEFAGRFAGYFPRSLSSLLFYVGLAGVIHATARVGNAYGAFSDRFMASR
ncbi:MAG: conserved membrane protein of unknown function [Nitrospira sp.]|nr:MAG: conserved membrane protein of unknown function [Nitrospira sp.]